MSLEVAGMKMNMNVVGIEDEPQWIQEIEGSLRARISDGQKNRYGIESMSLETADSKQGALVLFEKLSRKGESPDVIIVDLKIPHVSAKDGGIENVRYGIELLSDARRMFPEAEILVYSVLEEYEQAVKSFSGGAIDFMRKGTVVGGELLDRVLAAGARRLARQSARLLEQRLKDLVPYAETGLAHRLGVCFSRFVQSVVNETEGLEEGLKERWGLDKKRDAQDSQIRHLIEMQAAVQQAKKDWTCIVSKLIDRDEEATDRVVEEALAEVQEELMPSLSLNRVTLNFDKNTKTVVRTFRNGADDVKAVLKEILLGGLSERGAKTEHLGGGEDVVEGANVRPVDVSITTKDGQAEIQFTDSLTHIDENSAQLINGGSIVPPDGTFGRAWGLSVAQHLAQRGGGKLKVCPNGNGNVITYSIPLANHGKSASGR